MTSCQQPTQTQVSRGSEQTYRRAHPSLDLDFANIFGEGANQVLSFAKARWGAAWV